MRKDQFDAAVQMIRDRKDLSNVDDTIMDGCGLPGFKPVTITLEMAAKFIAWQCVQLNGQFDAKALDECREISRKRWLVC